MRKSILRSMLCCVALALCLLLVFAAFVFDIRLTDNSKAALSATANAFALSFNPNSNIPQQVADMDNASENIRITIISPNGTPLADSVADVSDMENHLNREEIKLARAANSGAAVRASETLGKKLLYTAVKTPDGYYLRLAMEQSGFLYDVVSLLPWLFVAAALSILLAFPLTSRLARSVARPLTQLGNSLKSVKNGGAKLNAESFKYTELQDMASDINDLSDEINVTLSRLEGEKQRISYILDNMREGFIMLNYNDTVLMINTAACEAFSCKQASVMGKNILHATRNVPLLDAISSSRTQRAHKSVELQLPERREGEAHISTVEPEGGVIIIISDVTESKSAAKMRQEFFQSASHELKTPITSIQGFADLLASGTGALSAEETKNVYKRIAKETSRMTTLINDIIMISRLESGDMFFEKELLDVGAVINEICADASLQAKQSGVTLKCEVVSAVRSISRRELTELVGNLVQNAIKYNVQNGEVRVSLTSSGGELTLSVFNTGEPIANEYRTRIFERFFRIDKGRSKAAGGTGLGLAIVKHVAQRLGATVSLNVNSNGNTFIISLPK